MYVFTAMKFHEYLWTQHNIKCTAVVNKEDWPRFATISSNLECCFG